MAQSQSIFGLCNEMSVAGIKELKLSAKTNTGDPIEYPIDVVIKNGDEAIILGSINETARTITIGEQTTEYVQPVVDTSLFTEELTEDRRGKYYTQTIDFSFPKVELFTNNQIKDFLFDTSGQLAIANAYAIITDNNDVEWIVGYDLPLIVETLEVDINPDGGDNLYKMVLVGKSYNRIRRYENV